MVVKQDKARSFLLRNQDFFSRAEPVRRDDRTDVKINFLESFLMDAMNAIEGTYKDLVEDPAYKKGRPTTRDQSRPCTFSTHTFT